jgi:hypothetical protein
MQFEFFIQITFIKKMEKIPVQIGLLLFFISMIFFSQNGMEIKDVLIRSLVISLASVILLQVTILFAAKSLGSSNERAGFTENNKKPAKENREGNR